MAALPTINDKIYVGKKASGPDSAHKSSNDLIYVANGGGLRKSINDILWVRYATPVRGSVNDRLYYAMKPTGPNSAHLSISDLLRAANGVLP